MRKWHGSDQTAFGYIQIERRILLLFFSSLNKIISNWITMFVFITRREPITCNDVRHPFYDIITWNTRCLLTITTSIYTDFFCSAGQYFAELLFFIHPNTRPIYRAKNMRMDKNPQYNTRGKYREKPQERKKNNKKYDWSENKNRIKLMRSDHDKGRTITKSEKKSV